MSLEKLAPYEFLGLDLPTPPEGAKDVSIICPFCESIVDGQQKAGKFGIKIKTGQYNCYHCGDHGNIYTFLTKLYESAKELTNAREYKSLARLRPGLDWQSLRDTGFVFLHAGDEPRWAFPVRNSTGALVNYRLYALREEKLGYPMGVKGLPLQLGTIDTFRSTGPIYVTEGEWDAIAMFRLLRKSKRHTKSTVMACPGCKVFKQEWLETFKGREVNLLYDNDSAGAEGMDRTAHMLQGRASVVRVIEWPASIREGFDISDYVEDRLAQNHEWQPSLELLQRMLSVYSGGHNHIHVEENLPPLKRTTFQSVIKDYRKYYHFPQRMADSLAVSTATIIASQTHGDPLWSFLTGPPGTGKTLILKTTQASPQVIFQSRLRSTSLISGYQTTDGEDMSLLPQLRNKCLVNKDFTSILSQPYMERESLFGLLRDLFDGRADVSYGNERGRVTYEDCYFSFLAGVTDEIRNQCHSELGERFLMHQVIDNDVAYDPSKQIRSAIDGVGSESQAEKFLCRSFSAFADREDLVNEANLPNCPKWIIDRIVALVQIVSFMRARHRGGPKDNLSYRTTPEIGTRLAKQLIKLGKMLAIVYGQTSIDRKNYQLVESVAIDTCRGWPLEITRALMQAEPSPLQAGDLEDILDIPRSSIGRAMDSMHMHGLITRTRAGSNGRVGRPSNRYRVTERVRKLWKQAKIGE